MRSITLANSTDLDQWADRRDSHGILPQIIRRLIHGSIESKHIKQIDFPAFDAVALAGWDGTLATQRGNGFVPDGISGWELTARSDSKPKADNDYAGRCTNPDGLDPSGTTYIHVTLRRWGEKKKWKELKRATGKWKNVLAYDARDLEQWLEMVPAVHIWVSQLVNKQHPSVEDLDNFWLGWSKTPYVPLSEKIILAGRDEITEVVLRKLELESDTLLLMAGTRSEAVAVFFAIVGKMSPPMRESVLARTVVIHDRPGWEHITNVHSGLFLIPMFNCLDCLGHAKTGGHRVIIPLGKNDGGWDRPVVAPPLPIATVEQHLRENGVPPERAAALASIAHGDIDAYRQQHLYP